MKALQASTQYLQHGPLDLSRVTQRLRQGRSMSQSSPRPGSWTSASIALATPVNELTTVHSAAPTLTSTLTSSGLTHGKYACGAELASNRSKPLQPLQRVGLCRRENRRCPVTATAKTLNSRHSCNSALSIRSPRRQSEHLFHDGLVFPWGTFTVFCAVCTMGSCTCLATGISM